MRGRPCGRKRQLVVDTQGRLWAAAVHAANEGDGPGAIRVIGDILWGAGERLKKVYGDQAYNGVFKKALGEWSIDFEKASRAESEKGFVPVAKRWVVERSIAWTNRTGDPVLSSVNEGLRIHTEFIGKLALFGKYSAHATANAFKIRYLIPQHILTFDMTRTNKHWLLDYEYFFVSQKLTKENFYTDTCEGRSYSYYEEKGLLQNEQIIPHDYLENCFEGWIKRFWSERMSIGRIELLA
jgi:transposase